MTPSDRTGKATGKRKHSPEGNPDDASSPPNIAGLPIPATKKPRKTSLRLFKDNVAPPQAQAGTQHSRHVNEMQVTRKLDPSGKKKAVSGS